MSNRVTVSMKTVRSSTKGKGKATSAAALLGISSTGKSDNSYRTVDSDDRTVDKAATRAESAVQVI